MSLLSRLRDWVASLFGSGGKAVGAESEGTAPAADHACTVCGTPVEDPAEGCPLCGSLDVEPRTVTDPPATDAGESGAASAGPAPDAPEDGTGTPGSHRQSVEGTTDDAVTRLRDVRRGAGNGESGGEGDATDGSDGRPD